ncbi:GNAT family N-acetyltransferase [Leptothrix ochracea]|uniref:GNAT family N-acetyltransferase n=1 Tax=Leptothrix ochracea TaxID=735331 RepID=UPI0034E29D3B
MNSSTSEEIAAIDVFLGPMPALAELEAEWQALEVFAEPSFFTSWSWIGCWLALLPANVKPQWLRARQSGRTVGLALLVRRTRQRFGLPFCDSWHLHETGDPDYDILTIEHNGFLLDTVLADVVREAMLVHWVKHTSGASELLLPGQAGSGLSEQTLPALYRGNRTRTSYGVNLEAVRERQGDYLALLSSNTRSQIRRSIKEYQTIGPLVVHEAQDVAQAHHFLSRLAEMHQQHWVERGEPGAFSNPFFKRFHERLIEENLPRGQIQILRISAGEQDMAYLYSFVKSGRIYFYQSGFDYRLIEKHGRPGLVAHALAVQHNAALGHMVYDFMAGDSRYKLNLATINEPMTWSTLRKPAWRFRMEHALREWRYRMKAKKAAKCEEVEA